MRFIKKHRYTLIMILAFVLLICLGLKMKDVLVPDEGKATYGKRLDGIGEHPITDDVYTKISDEYEKNSSVKKISYRLQGKVLNYFIVFDDKVEVKDAKSLGEKIITYFNEDQLGYYSIQIYLEKDDETLNNFPIIGMKDPLSDKVIWSKDREIDNESDKNEN